MHSVQLQNGVLLLGLRTPIVVMDMALDAAWVAMTQTSHVVLAASECLTSVLVLVAASIDLHRRVQCLPDHDTLLHCQCNYFPGAIDQDQDQCLGC